MMKRVRDGERLSGHLKPGCQNAPEIHILEGHGHSGGTLICTIRSFRWAEVSIGVNLTGEIIELLFEGKTCLQIAGGMVEYSDGCAESSPETAKDTTHIKRAGNAVRFTTYPSYPGDPELKQAIYAHLAGRRSRLREEK